VGEEDYGLVDNTVYSEHIKRTLGDSLLGRKTSGALLERVKEVSVTKQQLTELKINKDEISCVVISVVLCDPTPPPPPLGLLSAMVCCW